MTQERFNFFDYILFALIILLFAVFSFIFQINQIFSFDQTQMLIKGYHAALTGEYLPFGNEASTTGNLPGSLSSWVIGFPFSMYFHAYSPIYFQIILRIIAIIFFANGLAQIFSKKIVIAGTFLFAFSTWTLMQGMLYNPAYLPVGACAFFCALAHLRNDNESRTTPFGRIMWSILSVLGIGWCLQFHFSWPVLLFIAGIMWLGRYIKVSYIGLIIGAGLVGLSLWPYIQELMLNPTLAKSPDEYGSERYIGYGFVHVYPVLKGLLYWFRFGSLLFTQKAIVPEFEVDEIGLGLAIVAYAWIAVSSLIGGLTVLFAAYCNYFTLYRYRLSNHQGRLRFVRGITFSSILAVLIAAGLNTLTLNYWQIAIVMPFALIPVLTYMAQSPRQFKQYMSLAMCFLAATNILAATYSSDYDIRVNYRKELYVNCLLAFTKGQCRPLAEGLSRFDITDANKTEINPSTVLRVIDGIKPLPQNADAEYVEMYENALKNVRHYKFTLPNDPRQGQFSTVPATEDANADKEKAADGKAAGDASDAGTAADKDTKEVKDAAADSKDAKAEDSKAKDNKAEASKADAKAAKDVKAAKDDQPADAAKDSAAKAADTKDKAAQDAEQKTASAPAPASTGTPDAPQETQGYIKPATAPIESEAFKPQGGQIIDQGSGASGELVIL